MRAILDPRLRTAIPDHWPSRCNLFTASSTPDASNQPIPTTPTLIQGDVQCRIGPLILIRPTDKEIRDNAITETQEYREIKFNGYFPQLAPGNLIDVWTYPHTIVEHWRVVGVEDDGNKFSTRARIEDINP